MVHQEKPQQMLRLFCCTIPFGTDSHFAQALVFVSRGLVTKNAPQEHFLNAPTDGAAKYALQEIAARFLLQSFKEGSIWCTIPFGTDSHFAQALVFVSRGLVAKNGCGFVSRGHD